MKVLLINGSPRKQGNTNIALNEVANQLEKNGIETEIVWIGNKAVRGCIACGKCKENANGKCVFDDDITNKISAMAANADAFVLGAPVYYGQPAGQIQCLVQRLLFSNGANFAGKPVANIAVCRRGGATAAFQTMNMPWMMVNCPIVTSQYWNIAYGREQGQAAFDGEGMQTMRTLANNMAAMLKGLNGALPGSTEDWAPTHFVREDLINGQD